jgi:hypothetical protein
MLARRHEVFQLVLTAATIMPGTGEWAVRSRDCRNDSSHDEVCQMEFLGGYWAPRQNVKHEIGPPSLGAIPPPRRFQCGVLPGAEGGRALPFCRGGLLQKRRACCAGAAGKTARTPVVLPQGPAAEAARMCRAPLSYDGGPVPSRRTAGSTAVFRRPHRFATAPGVCDRSWLGGRVVQRSAAQRGHYTGSPITTTAAHNRNRHARSVHGAAATAAAHEKQAGSLHLLLFVKELPRRNFAATA